MQSGCWVLQLISNSKKESELLISAEERSSRSFIFLGTLVRLIICVYISMLRISILSLGASCFPIAFLLCLTVLSIVFFVINVLYFFFLGC